MAKKGTLFGKPREEVVKHPGAFTAKAQKAGKSTGAYASQVLKPSSKASTQTKRQANLAKTFAKLRAGKAKFLVPLVLVLASAAHAATVTCPQGWLIGPTAQAATGVSANQLVARAAPALVIEALSAAGTATVQVEMCCSPIDCNAAGTWAVVTGSAMTLAAATPQVVSVVSPTCIYRANVTACTGCTVTVVAACAGS
jgi:hypothetical protein